MLKTKILFVFGTWSRDGGKGLYLNYRLLHGFHKISIKKVESNCKIILIFKCRVQLVKSIWKLCRQWKQSQLNSRWREQRRKLAEAGCSCNQLIISLRLSLPAHNNHLGCFAVCSPHNIYLNHYTKYFTFIITILHTDYKHSLQYSIFYLILIRIKNSICVGKFEINTNISMCWQGLKFNLDQIGFSFGQMCHHHQPSPLNSTVITQNQSKIWN